jgi:hypothetical protein
MEAHGILSTSPKDPRLFELFCGAIETALDYVRLAKTGKTHVGKHNNWPELRWHEGSGLPWVTTRLEGPENYGDAIGGIYSMLYAMGLKEEPLDFSKEQNFVALVEYSKSQPRLLSYLEFDAHDFGASHLRGMVADMLDRYIHVNKTLELEPAKLLPIYIPMEARLFVELLPIVIAVPILFLTFEFQQFQLSEFVSIEAISEELYLAQGWRGDFPFSSSADNSIVESAATHALFVRNRSVENDQWFKLGQRKMSLETYPVEEINAFFAAVQIPTGYPTGYAKMIALPVGWASSYVANISPVDGPSVENYPPFFKQGYWQHEIPSVDSAEAETIRNTFEDLQKIFATRHARRVQLAMHRLNLSSLRTTDEDGIIDTMVAMEALLSDDRQEMTHKVAMRLAALYKIVNPSLVEQAFKEVKAVYNFRSKIVHGDANLDKFRYITRNGAQISAISAAVEHLRTAFAVLIKHPALLDPTKIDRFLLTDKLHEDTEQ